MHEALLIHNDNTPFLEKFDLFIKFNPSAEEFNNSDIDSYISNQIIPKLVSINFKIIYIKDTLSENYIDFYGLILAHHIRLSSNILKEKSFLPIVILSDINEVMINKLSYFGRILFTKNIFLCANKIDTLNHIHNLKFQSLRIEEFKHYFLDLIVLNPPEDSDHHSIANEWAIYQWSKMLDLSTALNNKKMDQVSNSLYFKYLKNKYNLQDKTKNDGIKKIDLQGKVLLIDDKWADGWKEVITEFASRHYDNVVCGTLEWDNKNLTFDNLKSLIIDKIISFDPDIILLDLRIIDNEENTIQISKISGIQILKYLREECKGIINQGIQIIIFSASGDSLIVEEAGKYRTLGYVKKDSPINKYVASKGSFSKLDQLIKDGIKRKYLKDIWKIRQSILLLPKIQTAKLILENDANQLFEIKNNVEYVFDILNSNLPKPNLYAMYAIFKCLELIVEMYIWEEKRPEGFCALWRESNKIVDGFNSTENKIKQIMEHKLNLVNQELNAEIKKIVCCRNYSIHGGEKPNCRDITIKQPNETHILNWFEMLSMILAKMDK